MVPQVVRIAAALSLLSVAQVPGSATALSFASPDKTAVISVDLGSIGPGELEVRWYDTVEGGRCETGLMVVTSQLPSIRLVPRPLELAEAIGPIVRGWGATECTIYVQLIDDTDRDLDESDSCWRGDYRYNETEWWPYRPDHRCGEPDA